MFNGTTTYEGLIKEAAAPLYLLSNVSTHTLYTVSKLAPASSWSILDTTHPLPLVLAKTKIAFKKGNFPVSKMIQNRILESRME